MAKEPKNHGNGWTPADGTLEQLAKRTRRRA